MVQARGTLAITAAGMVSSLGADVEVACAAARAGLTQTSEGEYTVKDVEAEAMVPVTVHPVGRLTLGFAEVGRWVRLGSLALRNLLKRSAWAGSGWERTAVLINLPGDFLPRSAFQALTRQAAAKKEPPPEPEPVSYAGLQPYYRAELVPKLLRAAGVAASPAVHEVFFEDETGIVTVLRRAAELLRSGKVSRCLVAGVDSLLEPRWMEAAHVLRVMKSATRPAGFMPGEGAAFLCVEETERVRREERPILATVEGLVLQQDASNRFASPPPDGRVLSEVIRASLQQAPGRCMGFYGDLNGDAVRAQEWGVAQLRLGRESVPDSVIVPAESFGETRAAYGFIAASMATQAFARGYHPSETLLVWAATYSGARGSFTLTRHPSQGAER
ncbi:hypothetical protein JY651_43755 [Pyxidicoccus parkwayensis]|uniref:Beta-ketoacyl synthase-like N-terminal domain-containing protein n=1 Tax=Pyxidicoccus parkwayensis TaxID=2813578 RepID=A0ABX7NSW6_9BACT|nr:beta-ketoacyl synthase N-terminal-like domain-containing protein [Pyxidicoccus parkwaysis]QSQ21990.1 hypothetical protein JY651_43755 [Pyxidicoccus parkwaysis]